MTSERIYEYEELNNEDIIQPDYSNCKNNPSEVVIAHELFQTAVLKVSPHLCIHVSELRLDGLRIQLALVLVHEICCQRSENYQQGED